MLWESGRLRLERPGKGQRDLRAWDAADPQLVEQAMVQLDAVRSESQVNPRVAIVDDSFGALTLALGQYGPISVADSALLQPSVTINARLNSLEVPEIADWRMPPDGCFDIIVLKIPRQVDYLEYLLRWVNAHLAPNGRLIAGGMIKHLPDRCAQLFEALMGSNEPLRARQKARVILSQRGTATLDDWDGLWRGYTLSGGVGPVKALPAVFARERLDIGSREFLPYVVSAIESLPDGARVLDLGCGNGVLGLSALAARDDIRVTFADVSSQAVASAEQNCYDSGFGERSRFHHTDAVPVGERYDLILCNPPFHEGGAVGDHIALRMFRQSAKALSGQGQLLVVGNRHLGYHVKLRNTFRQVQQLASSPKFVVFACRHR
ncbi:class I SAM-dependent methyltransferase [Marinobacter nanhaiticus D15-8W]|uniref:Class I SAM-dependent methyltransferase n=2 Tax=Marinobacter TaxID=2742 RepID=N6W0A9_9GAMM|nr:class I SAM-dependent methyltransferase [Marinobacter nanhaiticus D15-8W]